jgi:hypothetical protein
VNYLVSIAIAPILKHFQFPSSFGFLVHLSFFFNTFRSPSFFIIKFSIFLLQVFSPLLLLCFCYLSIIICYSPKDVMVFINNHINDFNYNKHIMNIMNTNLKYKLKVMNIKFDHKSNYYCN